MGQIRLALSFAIWASLMPAASVARWHSLPAIDPNPTATDSDVIWLAREAIQQVNTVARELARNPANPRVRADFREAMDNLALARQALDEEVRLGNISWASRSAILSDMASNVELPDLPSVTAPARQEEAKPEDTEGFFVPNTIAEAENKKVKVKVRVEEPQPSSNTQVFYIRGGVTGVAPTGASITSQPLPPPSGKGKQKPVSPALTEQSVRRVEVAYNPPLASGATGGAGAAASASTTLNGKKDKPVNLLTPVLAGALERFRKKSSESRGAASSEASAESGEGTSYARGLSGRTSEAGASGPGYIPQFYDLIVKARSLASHSDDMIWTSEDGSWAYFVLQCARFLVVVAFVYGLLWTGNQLAPIFAAGRKGQLGAVGRETTRERQGETVKKLEPRQLYVRVEPGTKRWVLVRTDDQGEVSETVGQVCAGTVVSGGLLPSGDTLRRYKLDSGGAWAPTEDVEQFVLWSKSGGSRRT